MNGKMENPKRRMLSCLREDRISNLPEHLIDSILERLPFQEAVRTSILSKKWRYRWTTLRVLVIDEDFSKKFGKNGAFGRNGFIRIINQVLILHKGPILKFYLHIPNMFLDSFQEIDQWMLFLSRSGVKELVLTNSNRRYELPSYVFSCLELKKLILENCIFKPPLGLGAFLNLEDIFLKNIDFGANFWGNPVSLPQLKKLSLHTCTNVYNFNIKATKLQTLLVITCPDAMLLQLIDSPCLTVVGISFRKPIEDFVRVEMMNFVKLLSNLPKIEHFFIDGYFLKFLCVDKILKRLPHAVNSLKRLWLLNFRLDDLDHLHSALCLLRSSPNLERLCIMHVQTPQVMNHDVGPASNYLEAPDCLDQTLDQLRTVEITSIEGSKQELLFIKLLLARCPSLEKLTIRPNATSDAYKRLSIAEDVMRFPRVSPKAEMIYLNSKP